MEAVPRVGKSSDLMQRNRFTAWEPMALAPIVNRFLRIEG
jgi:hypothetical protein